jgi:DNA-binding LacI/PurR family transcriptional regulator
VLSEFGKRAPQDVLVAGYDDIEIAQHFTPSITTVRQPVVEAGHRMLDELISIAAGDPNHKREPVLLSTTLAVRSSSRAA